MSLVLALAEIIMFKLTEGMCLSLLIVIKWREFMNGFIHIIQRCIHKYD